MKRNDNNVMKYTPFEAKEVFYIKQIIRLVQTVIFIHSEPCYRSGTFSSIRVSGKFDDIKFICEKFKTKYMKAVYFKQCKYPSKDFILYQK